MSTHHQAQIETKIVTELKGLLDRLQGRVDTYAGHAATMQILINAGEARRLGRTRDITIDEVQFRNGRVLAQILGSSGKSYETRITLSPKRGHHCTCSDWQQNGRRIGPCKHVLALGHYWLDQKVLPAMSDLMTNLAYALKP